MRARVDRGHRIVMRGSNLRRIAREKLGISTVNGLAERLHVDAGDLSRYLNGKRVPPVSVIAAVLDLYREPFDRLFAVELNPPVGAPVDLAA